MYSGGRISFSESRKVAWALGGGHRPVLVSYLPEDGDNRERNTKLDAMQTGNDPSIKTACSLALILSV